MSDDKKAKKPQGAPPQAKQGKPGGKPEKDAKGKKGAASLAGPRPKPPAGYKPRLRTFYAESVVPALTKTFSYPNPMMVPRLQKIVINIGVGEATQNPRVIESVAKEVAMFTGQKPKIAKARKSVSNFKLREGMPIGVYVTLRRDMMWEFMDRLIAIAAPRIRDFRGLSDRGFDGRGNCTIGFKEQIIFPEINLDDIEKIRGLDITFVTTAPTDKEAYELLKELGVPFRKREKQQTAEAA
jgi:large subunit ribosomal protein L5